MSAPGPAEQAAAAMGRVYARGLTSSSGGNISLLDRNGDIWITPSGTDKGAMTAGDVCRVKPDGTREGRHNPSIELPFHASVYRRRPGLRAVIHAHSPVSAAFSAARRLPEVTPFGVTAVLAPYALPGSAALEEIVASGFERGYDIVLMENHGVCAGGRTLTDAFMKLEAFENCAAIALNARKLGTVIYGTAPPAPEDGEPAGLYEKERRELAAFARRCYEHRLFTSSQGELSLRLPDGTFLITSPYTDRAVTGPEDISLIRTPSAHPHGSLYLKYPRVRAVAGGVPPHAAAFAVTGTPLDTRTIPECYIRLHPSRGVPSLFLENGNVLAAGETLFDAFDRLEVAEAAARSVLASLELGGAVFIGENELREIDKTFGLE